MHANCVFMCVCILQYESSGLGLISSRLRTTLNRIQESLIDMVRLQLFHSSSTVCLTFLIYSILTISLLPLLISSLPISFPDTNMSFPFPTSHPPSLCPSLLFVPPYFLPIHSIHHDHMCAQSPPSPQNALWVVIIWPVVTHTYMHLSLCKWPHQG